MKRISSLLVVALLLIAAADGQPSSKKKSQMKNDIVACAHNYMIDNKMLNATKVNKFTRKNVNCEHFVSEILVAFYNDTNKSYTDDADFAPHKPCIMEKLNDFNFVQTYLENYVQKRDKKMSKLRREMATRETSARLNMKFDLAEEVCVPEIIFGEQFDALYGESPIANVTEVEEQLEEDIVEKLQEDFCLRKHLVDSKFIDTRKNNITLNPKHVNVDDLDCDKIWNETALEYSIDLKDRLEAGLNAPASAEVRCIFKTIRASNYAESLLKIWALGEIKDQIGKKKRTTERTAYINFMVGLYTDIFKCIKSE